MHINSNNKHTYKKAALITNLRKVDYMASDDMNHDVNWKLDR